MRRVSRKANPSCGDDATNPDFFWRALRATRRAVRAFCPWRTASARVCGLAESRYPAPASNFSCPSARWLPAIGHPVVWPEFDHMNREGHIADCPWSSQRSSVVMTAAARPERTCSLLLQNSGLSEDNLIRDPLGRSRPQHVTCTFRK